MPTSRAIGTKWKEHANSSRYCPEHSYHFCLSLSMRAQSDSRQGRVATVPVFSCVPLFSGGAKIVVREWPVRRCQPAAPASSTTGNVTTRKTERKDNRRPYGDCQGHTTTITERTKPTQKEHLAICSSQVQSVLHAREHLEPENELWSVGNERGLELC